MRLKLVVGASVEAFSENDWWDAKIREVTDSEVKVFYIGGLPDSIFSHCDLFFPISCFCAVSLVTQVSKTEIPSPLALAGSEDDAEWISLDETKTRLRAPRAGPSSV